MAYGTRWYGGRSYGDSTRIKLYAPPPTAQGWVRYAGAWVPITGLAGIRWM